MTSKIELILGKTRNRIADFMLMVMVAAGFPALLGAVYRDTAEAAIISQLPQVAIFVIMLAMLIFRSKMSAVVKSTVIVSAMTVLGGLYLSLFTPGSGMALLIVGTAIFAVFNSFRKTLVYAVLCMSIILVVGALRVSGLYPEIMSDGHHVHHTIPVWASTFFGYAWMSAALVVGVVWMRQALLQSGLDQMRSHNEIAMGHNFLEQIRTSAADVASYFSSLQRIEDVSFQPTLLKFVDILNVDRASLWLQDENGDVYCVGLVDKTDPNVSHEGLVLRRCDLPRYFAALHTGQAIDAVDAQDDPRTSEFTDNYLRPLNIRGMLDVPLVTGVGSFGVLCFECIGQVRHWRPDEIVFAHTAAGLLAAAAGIKTAMETSDKLSLSQRKFEAVANYTYDWESWIAPDGGALWVNPAIERILGYRPEECIAMEHYPLPLVLREDRDRVRHYLEEGFSGLSGNDREFTAIHKSGQHVGIAMSWQPIRDSQGRYQGIRVSCRDATERIESRRDLERALSQLEANQRRLRAHFNNTKLGVIYWTPDRTIIEINETAERMFGFDAGELVGKKVEILVPPSERGRLSSLVLDVTKTRTSVNTRFPNVTKQGKYIICEWYESPIFDNNGDLDCVASFALDVTDRERYQETLDSIYRGIKSQVGTDFFENLTKVLCETLDMSFCHVAELHGTRLKSVALFSPLKSRELMDFDLAGSPAEEVIKRGIMVYADGLADDFGGDERVSEDHARGYAGAALYDDDGNAIGVLVTISDKPLADPELAVSMLEVFAGRASAELQRLRSERNRQKLEHQLQHSQRMETIGVLAGGIAHDFNNILQPISGYAELLYTDLPEDSPLRDDVSEIRSGAERARDLVKQILMFSRNTDEETSVLSVEAMVKGAVRFARGSIPSSVLLKTEIAPDLPGILGNATQIDQCLMNLITNAYHAVGDRGEIRIEVGLFELTEDIAAERPLLDLGEYIRISVIDNGCGMDEETAKRIFDPFFTTKETGKGTGLGLSTVHGIITGHKGVIDVYSRLEQGTRFSILLPVFDEDITITSQRAIELSPGVGGHIVVVDDEEKNLRLCQRMLGRMGYEATCFNRATDALAALRDPTQEFCLLLTDQTMPDMNGVQLIASLRDEGNDIPVIVMTGYASEGVTENWRQLDVAMMLAKPFDIVELHDGLETVLGSGKAVTAPSSEPSATEKSGEA